MIPYGWYENELPSKPAPSANPLPLCIAPQPYGADPPPAGQGLAEFVQSTTWAAVIEVSEMPVAADENPNCSPVIEDSTAAVGSTVSASVIDSELPSLEKLKSAIPC